MTLKNIEAWARRKGIDIVGTGDFTHPAHFAAITEELEEAPDAPGLFRLKGGGGGKRPVYFMLTSEVSNIYSTRSGEEKKTRKIHSLIFAPTIEAVRRMNEKFASLGNIRSDGRPIFGFTAQDLIKIVLDASEDAMLVPAHAWTPWFSIFGSKSGFDTIEECFGDYSKYIYAIETGLSSNPAMNWRLSGLDSITLISNSDAHSPRKLGREANVFDAKPDFYEIMRIIREKDRERFLYTIEFYPEEGKYHADGHRACGILWSPEETAANDSICTECGRPVTVGVLNRVMELADRAEGFRPLGAAEARHIVPLEEIIARVMERGVATKGVLHEYRRLTDEATEFDILLDIDRDGLTKLCGTKLAEAVLSVRAGDISITPGFDGEFGKIDIFAKEAAPQKAATLKQMGLF